MPSVQNKKLKDLDKKDKLALAAMQSILPKIFGIENYMERTAMISYAMAEAMIKRREFLDTTCQI